LQVPFDLPVPGAYSSDIPRRIEYDISQKIVTYKQLTPVASIPFLPKFSSVRERIRIGWISLNEAVIETEVKVSDIPMCDSFIVINRYNELNRYLYLYKSHKQNILFFFEPRVNLVEENGDLHATSIGSVKWLK
jgi:hypothetical protein